MPLQSSAPEDVFAQIFCETFGPESAQYLVPQYPFQDIYGKGRFIDYALRTNWEQFAFEIDSVFYHAPDSIGLEKWEDDLLRQNSLVQNRWRVFRWTDRQLAQERERVQEELLLFLQGTRFVVRDDYLPLQRATLVELHEHQQEALANLAQLRQDGVTIALLTHAQGMGKTRVAVEDARRVNQRTLFLAHTRELVEQADTAFRRHWPEASVRVFDRTQNIRGATVVVGTIQGIAGNLRLFRPDDFGYMVIDEAHHATAETYQRVIGYFRTRFLLGLTATPFRADNASVLQLFQNMAHRMSLEDAIKGGHLVPIRCVRVTTNIDMRDVRFNGVKYNSRDLEVRLIVRERDDLIVKTYMDHTPGKRAVAFCVNVRHAESLAEAFRARGVPAQAVSGGLASQERKARLLDYHAGHTLVLCACDLLNEGWDSPETEVLLMARPTLSRVVYLQQIGRGTRKSPGKEALIVFDFVDNATMVNRSISLHSLLGKKEYRPGELVLAPDDAIREEQERIAAGEKPEAILSLNLWVKDLEVVDILDWRKEAEEMLSAARLSIELGVDRTTISNWVTSGKVEPDLIVPLGNNTYYYFRPERASTGSISDCRRSRLRRAKRLS
ncbi:MAG: DEAD/DEAH box helicase [Chloroflexota bacterium]|nr:MAG: DEAD/DEAH box helicase [Chloroflexota bacterium]